MEEHRSELKHFLLHHDIGDLMTTHVIIFSIHLVTSGKDNDEFVLIHIDIKIDVFFL